MRPLAGAVLAVEMVIAWLALHPNVPDDYRAFFIARSSDCLLRPVDGKLPESGVAHLVAGSPDNRHVVGCGLSNPEPLGTWTVGQEAAFVMQIPAERPGRFVIEVAGAFLPEGLERQRVAVIVGDSRVGQFEATRETLQPQSFAVPPTALGATDGRLLVRLELPDAGRPIDWPGSSTDTRALGVIVSSVGLLP